jgi:hypothetical protein
MKRHLSKKKAINQSNFILPFKNRFKKKTYMFSEGKAKNERHME